MPKVRKSLLLSVSLLLTNLYRSEFPIALQYGISSNIFLYKVDQVSGRLLFCAFCGAMCFLVHKFSCRSACKAFVVSKPLFLQTSCPQITSFSSCVFAPFFAAALITHRSEACFTSCHTSATRHCVACFPLRFRRGVTSCVIPRAILIRATG